MPDSRHHVSQPRSEVPQLIVMVFGLAGIVALVTLVILLVPGLIDPFTEKKHNNDNRTWLMDYWTQANRSPEEIAGLAQQMQDNTIRAVYVRTNRWHGQTGEFVALPYNASFLERFRNQAPGIRVYAWLVVPADKLSSPEDRQQVVEFAENAVLEQGFDGIHLQTFAVPDNDIDYINLLHNLRTAIGQGAYLSVTVPPDRIPSDPDVPLNPDVSEELDWSNEYKRRVVLNVNEIVLMAHASSLTTPEDYQIWVAYQVETYAGIIVGLDVDVSYIIALPTYDAEPGHDPVIENPFTAVRGILQSFRQNASTETRVTGTGLYPWQTTDDVELTAYRLEWVNRK